MAPMVAPIAQSESKARFFSRLGLDPRNPAHKRAYTLMKLEAAEGRRRLMATQTSSTAQIHEAAWQNEVLRIYRDARPETRAIYRAGHDYTTSGQMVDNWIIRWLLWHVFRYRDYRNKNRPLSMHQSPSSIDSSDDDRSLQHYNATPAGRGIPPSTAGPSNGVGPSVHSGRTRVVYPSPYWDPVRERYQA